MNAGPGPGCLHIELVPDIDAEVVADRCWALGATAVGESEGVLEVGFATTAAAEGAARSLGEWWPSLDVALVDAGPALLAALEAWKPFARPLRVGSLHVRPVWLDEDDDPPAAGERVVLVDPTLAFGFNHPSTVACLEQVGAWARPGASVLDVGCGSGVLAVAAAVLGAGPVVAIDTDLLAVAATMTAAERNGVTVDASDRSVTEVAGAFDLVVANIGAATLTDLAPAIAGRVAPDGHLVLAGLLPAQGAAVVERYEVSGFVLVTAEERSGWFSPVFLRKSTTSAP